MTKKCPFANIRAQTVLSEKIGNEFQRNVIL